MNSDGWVQTTAPAFSDSERGVLFKILKVLRGGGSGASLYVTGTGANTGTWSRITATEATVVATLTASDINGGVAITAVALAAGASIVGNITAFTLTSGAVQAFEQ